ncbi:hypothetical protein BAL199_17258 [alpha proteobacterium BAL199]|jgi:hypothetical protein|nr:hypothetical protein BAL199_17258 [alpha proteobacterium BAL199]
MDLNRFKADTALEDEGVWSTVDAASGCRLRIARIGNRRYRETMARRLKPYRRALRAGTLDDQVTERITAEVLAETVLLDWERLERDGVAVAYSREAAAAILADPAYKDFRDLVVELASDQESYRERDLEDAEKNSVTSSAGNSTGAGASTS